MLFFLFSIGVREVVMPAAFVKHGLKRAVVIPPKQTRGVRDAPLGVNQGPADVSGLVGVYLVGEIEASPEVGETAVTMGRQAGEARVHDPARALAQACYCFGILRAFEQVVREPVSL
jgi:hypothetical protein